MRTKRGRRRLDGWIIIDKPAGLTSTDIVNRVRRLTDATKIGHAGTLDPLATGVLPLALGEATKTVAHIVDATKTYLFTVAWGEARDTDDAEGAVTDVSAVRPTAEEIRAVLPRFLGEIEQMPPIFSARKVDGRRAYDMARAKEKVELAPGRVRIDRLELLAQPDADHADFEAHCGKGTYMRSLARDLARALGTVGHIAVLRRTRVGPFGQERAISLETLAALGHSPAASPDLAGHLLAVETALADIPALALTAEEANRLRCGQPVGLLKRSDRDRLGQLKSGSLVCAMMAGKLVALAMLAEGEVRPVRILNP